MPSQYFAGAVKTEPKVNAIFERSKLRTNYITYSTNPQQ
jgi:hypothetical protein